MQAPQLPGTLPAKDIKLLMQDAFDRNQNLQPLVTFTKNITAKNAYDWTNAFQAPAAKGETAEKIQLKPLLGHSNNAVKLPKGAILRYRFVSSSIGDARFTLATIPSYLPYEKNMRVSVSIDGAEPVICQMKEDYNSKEWKMNHWRGQALKSFYVTLLDGYHTVEIKAQDDNIIVDQWVLDFDVDREYYVFPVTR